MEDHGVSLLPEKLESEINRYKGIADESRTRAREIANKTYRQTNGGS